MKRCRFAPPRVPDWFAVETARVMQEVDFTLRDTETELRRALRPGDPVPRPRADGLSMQGALGAVATSLSVMGLSARRVLDGPAAAGDGNALRAAGRGWQANRSAASAPAGPGG
jgi:hypothetical protein